METGIDELARTAVLDPDGQAVTVGEFWRDRPAVIAWLRHFG